MRRMISFYKRMDHHYHDAVYLLTAWLGPVREEEKRLVDELRGQPELPNGFPISLPSLRELIELKNQIPYESWLYVNGAHELGIPFNVSTALFHLNIHTYQISEFLKKDKSIIPSNRSQDRWFWLRLWILNLSIIPHQRSFYELTAKATMQRAQHLAALRRMKQSLHEDEILKAAGRRAGVPEPDPQERKEEYRQEEETHRRELEGVIAPYELWPGNMYAPGFESWWKTELTKRSLAEIDSYLNVQWRVAKSVEDDVMDIRLRVDVEGIVYLKKLLKSAMVQVKRSDQLVLKQALRWFRDRRDELLKPEKSHLPAQNSDAERVPSSPPLPCTQGARKQPPSCLDEALTSRLSRSQLDKLLEDERLVYRDPATGYFIARNSTVPWQWAAVRSALTKLGMMSEAISHKDAADLFRSAYQAKVGRGTMGAEPPAEGGKSQNRRDLFYAKIIKLLSKLPQPAIEDSNA